MLQVIDMRWYIVEVFRLRISYLWAWIAAYFWSSVKVLCRCIDCCVFRGKLLWTSMAKKKVHLQNKTELYMVMGVQRSEPWQAVENSHWKGSWRWSKKHIILSYLITFLTYILVAQTASMHFYQRVHNVGSRIKKHQLSKYLHMWKNPRIPILKITYLMTSSLLMRQQNHKIDHRLIFHGEIPSKEDFNSTIILPCYSISDIW